MLAGLALGLAGCAGPAPPKNARTPAPPAALRTDLPPPAPARPGPIVTPGSALVGRVASVNPNRFVVLTFSIGLLPPPEKRLNVYRNGLKVGELKVTRWQMDTNAVADIVAGECRVGDEARED
jgi:hypothetical protein